MGGRRERSAHRFWDFGPRGRVSTPPGCALRMVMEAPSANGEPGTDQRRHSSVGPHPRLLNRIAKKPRGEGAVPLSIPQPVQEPASYALPLHLHFEVTVRLIRGSPRASLCSASEVPRSGRALALEPNPIPDFFHPHFAKANPAPRSPAGEGTTAGLQRSHLG